MTSFEIDWKEQVYKIFYYKHKHLVTSWREAYRNPLILEYLIKDVSADELDYRNLKFSSMLTAEIVSVSPHKWDHYNCVNAKISVKEMEQFPSLIQRNSFLPIYKTVNIDDILRHAEMNWPWDRVSENVGIKMEDIANNPQFPWDFGSVTINPNFHLDMVALYPKLDWNWYNISRHPNVSMDDIIAHPEYPWEFRSVVGNPRFDIKMISLFPDFSWDYFTISSNPGVSMEDINNHPEIHWSFIAISSNPNLTMNFLLQHQKDKKFDKRAISSN